MFFFTFIKNIKNMHKLLNYSIHSSKRHRQYKSNKVNNTATKHSLCPGNGVFAHEKCIIRPPVYGSNGRTYKMLVMFSFFFFATRSPSSLDRSH